MKLTKLACCGHQRYPNDFHGILAVAPANWSRLFTGLYTLTAV